MLGYPGADLGVTMDSRISLESLDLEAIRSLLHITNHEHEEFLITEKDKPIAAVIPLDMYASLTKKHDIKQQYIDRILTEYENELDSII